MDLYNKTGLILNNSTKIKKSNDTVHQLTRKPRKVATGDMPKFSFNYKPNEHQQADLLYMPHDDDFKYALVVVNVGYPRVCDSEPIKTKDAKTVLSAFKKIYKRKYLSFPMNIMCDSGNEFKGDVKEYFIDNGASIRYSETDRHRQLAIAENRNKTIANALFRLQYQKELKTGQPNTEWVKDLPNVIAALNDHAKKQKIPKPKPIPILSETNTPLLAIGTKVRKLLEAPREVLTTGKRLSTKFRATDIRYTPQVFTITDLYIVPNQVPLYILNDNENVRYSKDQLQVVKSKAAINEPVPVKAVKKTFKKDKVIEPVVEPVKVSRSGRVIKQKKIVSV